MKKYALFLIFLNLFSCLTPIYSENKKDTGRSFSWALICENKKGPLRLLHEEYSTVQLSKNDKIKFYLKPASDTYIYMVLYDSAKKLSLLFPEEFKLFDDSLFLKNSYFLPEGNQWFSPDNTPGIEIIYLLASSSRLVDFEQLFFEYFQLFNSTAESDLSVKYARKSVLDEIQRLIVENSFFTGSAERPIPVAGDFRGIEKSFQFNALEVDVENFYARTIRLEH